MSNTDSPQEDAPSDGTSPQFLKPWDSVDDIVDACGMRDYMRALVNSFLESTGHMPLEEDTPIQVSFDVAPLSEEQIQDGATQDAAYGLLLDHDSGSVVYTFEELEGMGFDALLAELRKRIRE